MLKGGTSSSYTVSAAFLLALRLSREPRICFGQIQFSFARKVALVSDFVLDSNVDSEKIGNEKPAPEYPKRALSNQ